MCVCVCIPTFRYAYFKKETILELSCRNLRVFSSKNTILSCKKKTTQTTGHGEAPPWMKYTLGFKNDMIQVVISSCLVEHESTFFFFLKSSIIAHGHSQARGKIRATAASLHNSHSNVGSDLHLRPTPQLMAMWDSWPTEWGQGLNLHPHGY